VVIGWLVSTARARRFVYRAPSIYAAANGWQASLGNFSTSGRQVQWTKRRRHVNWAVTACHRWEAAPPVVV